MSAISKQVNRFLKAATLDDINRIKASAALSERQADVFELFYVRRRSIIAIADRLCCSKTVIDRELSAIRRKLIRVI